MNENFEKYIGDLSPELQEKARACKTKEELNEFIAENDLELPEDALEVVAGGCGNCSHDCNKSLENWVSRGESPILKGVKAGNLQVRCCSKCGGNKKFFIVVEGFTKDDNYKDLYRSTSIEITESEFNTYKTGYNFYLQWKA